jgi:amino acid adenylation domain-containing protein
MSRYSGQSDVAIGTDIANRNRAEIEGLIGFFVNQLVLRMEVRERETSRGLLNRVREVCLGAYAHQDVPFEKLVEELQPERNLGRSPLFQVKLILQNAPGEELELEGLKLSRYTGEIPTARFDLTLSLTDAGGDLVGFVEYSRDLFEDETVERLMSHYRNLLEGIVEEDERPVSELSLLSDLERQQILVKWNETGRPFSHDKCIHQLLAQTAEEAGEQIALVSEGRQLSYGELDRRANQLGHYLQKLGVGPEVVVGICMRRSLEMVVGFLGILKAGGAYLPLDPESPLERLSYMLEDAGVGVVLTGEELEKRLPASWAQIVCVDKEWERISQENENRPESNVVTENIAYVIYTSGSSGTPKGVQVRHHGLVNSTLARLEYYGEPVRSFLLVSPFGFDSSVAGIYWTLCQGGKLVLPSERLERDPAKLARLMSENCTSHLLCLPTLYSLLLTEAAPWQINSLKCAIVAGEVCPPGVVERHADRLADAELFNEYGPTEGTVWSSVYGNCVKQSWFPVPIGKPIINARMFILGRELEPAPIGVRGEIYISGAGLARGYLSKPDLTAERFIPNPFSGEGA